MDNASDSISLDSRVSNAEGDTNLMEIIADESQAMEIWAAGALGLHRFDVELNEVDRYLVVHHFALEGGEPQTLQGMGKVLGISRERARQRLNRAMRKLQVLSYQCSAL